MPKGQYPRFKKAASASVEKSAAAPYQKIADEIDAAALAETELAPSEPALPRGWAKGALLNVRNNGAEYRITLYPEEFDPQQPERCLRFTNPAECQNFVSAWYQRTSNDPRAR